ncbi:hypothetical protein U732_3056 [Clostridium argentinense CDC 2741]|uniref:Uncharacterized protein n=1 Tax=Clostridium argentinense CDC 2741 TaxID=1418104 RepID=A0A0C1RB63_9CLOT|nr:hypothetical protein [Clostridium argentinense]HAG43774.1 hypothetical protein [Clostridium sp.]ARC84656.1 hypothetical protein RSJ17_08975 [Clostridium argentinense]KIE47666.1 hypothetical protein U732_3056 [Clostridium argentinense CDC 2741]NFF40164.1 hypothetical protein [Clostridium argentinense]NFP50633.1 hypothetical protein [Clostridium argentinense]
MESINQMIEDGYKIIKFKRDVDLISGSEIGEIEMKALDGKLSVVTIDDNGADDIEKIMFKYLRND